MIFLYIYIAFFFICRLHRDIKRLDGLETGLNKCTVQKTFPSHPHATFHLTVNLLPVGDRGTYISASNVQIPHCPWPDDEYFRIGILFSQIAHKAPVFVFFEGRKKAHLYDAGRLAMCLIQSYLSFSAW